MCRNIVLWYALRTVLRASNSVNLWKVVIVGANMLMLLFFAFAEGVVKIINAPFMHVITVRAITLQLGPFYIYATL